ncbi:MAG: D-alanyl-D-alanine carboxypeptidase family protein [Candidatus Paceibacterales bacterium]
MIYMRHRATFVMVSFTAVFLVAVIFVGAAWLVPNISQVISKNGKVLQGSLSTSINSVAIGQAQASAPLSQPQTPIIVPAPLPASAVVVPVQKPFLAESAISVNISPSGDGVLFQKNAEEKLPIASLTKLMTAMVVLDNYDLSKNITIDQGAMNQEGQQGVLQLGQTLSVESLLYVALIESSNRAAYALAEGMGTGQFIATMNMDAQKLGMSHTQFADVTGLSAASYSTAGDVATLARYLFEHYPLFKEIISKKTYDVYAADGSFHHQAQTTNQLLGQNNIIGGKTGFTDEAKQCFMTIENNPQTGGYIINVLLGSPDRVEDMKILIQNSKFKIQN